MGSPSSPHEAFVVGALASAEAGAAASLEVVSSGATCGGIKGSWVDSLATEIECAIINDVSVTVLAESESNTCASPRPCGHKGGMMHT